MNKMIHICISHFNSNIIFNILFEGQCYRKKRCWGAVFHLVFTSQRDTKAKAEPIQYQESGTTSMSPT